MYKNGQAGIVKATVSIVFDNSDRSQSPLGYEDSDEILVTRQASVKSIAEIYDDCRFQTFAV